MSVVDFPVPDDPIGLDRTPPSDIEAEQSVLGAMLLSKDAIADVVEVIRESDFYLPKHQAVYGTVLDLYGRGEPADAITVANELTRSGEISRIGGATYLHTLANLVPTSANAGYYARIVREQAILRRLAEAGTRITNWAFNGAGDVDDLVDRAQAEVYDVTDRRTSEDYAPLSEIMGDTLNEIEAISNRNGEMIGVPTGFHDLDALTNGLHPGQLIILAARPAIGKSTLGVDIARAASIKHGLTSAIFSLEMSRNEIVMRLLSAEAQVSLQHMRSGNMSDADWSRLAAKMGAVNDAPLFIDDSPNMTLMEIRAKCRRLKQRHDLRLVIVDYLQLMTSGKRVENRQQEVSEFSRSLKLLAKELEVPVIAISQLNRGPEQRTDKRPMLSDLRESGCLTASTRILRADTGAEVTLGALHESGEKDVPVWTLDDSLRYVIRPMTHVFSTGRKEVFRLRTASGRVIEATANHPMLTYDGWASLGALDIGSRIAIPRHVPAPVEEFTGWSDDQVIQAAGSVSVHVPSCVFSMPKRQIALFLRHLWATDGSIQITANGRGGRIYYATTSRRLADDVARLLLRFGLNARIRVAKKAGYRDGYHVDVSGGADQKVFLRRINAHGARGEVGKQLLAILEDIPTNTNRDTVPKEVWGKVREVISEQGMTHREFSAAIGTQFCGSTPWKHAPSRERLGRVAQVLDSAELEMLATNDVYWDEIVSVESIGEHEVFDATVIGTHNFIADGVAVHNSLEQDADMVVLLHREDAYEKESPRAGEADLIVAKHRNGPTSTVTVAFQGHYSRFVDMAHS